MKIENLDKLWLVEHAYNLSTWEKDEVGWIAVSLRAACVVESKASLRYIVKLFQNKKKACSSKLY